MSPRRTIQAGDYAAVAKASAWTGAALTVLRRVAEGDVAAGPAADAVPVLVDARTRLEVVIAALERATPLIAAAADSLEGDSGQETGK